MTLMLVAVEEMMTPMLIATNSRNGNSESPGGQI